MRKIIILRLNELIKNGSYYIEPIETYPSNSKDELLKRERNYKQSLGCVNINKLGIKLELGQKEYNKQPHIVEYQNKYQKIYQNENKEHLNKKNECICGGCYTT